MVKAIPAFFLVMIAGAVILYPRYKYKKIILSVAQLLDDTRVEEDGVHAGLSPVFRSFYAGGYYKGRRMELRFHLRSAPYEKVWTNPRWIARIDKGKPTRNTKIQSGFDIVYQKPLLFKICSKKSFLKVFEELCQAAEIVEAGVPYYKEDKE